MSAIGFYPRLDASSFYLLASSVRTASYTKFAEMWSHLKNPFTPTVVSSSATIASLLPLELANFLSYVDDISFVSDTLVAVLY